jgi:hypothetical protein
MKNSAASFSGGQSEKAFAKAMKNTEQQKSQSRFTLTVHLK